MVGRIRCGRVVMMAAVCVRDRIKRNLPRVMGHGSRLGGEPGRVAPLFRQLPPGTAK